MQKITVSLQEANAIKTLLVTGEKLDYETLVEKIVTDVQVKKHVAEAYATSWRHNHKDGETIPEPKVAYVATPLPVKTNKVLADPANGNGIVAQIIAMCEDGKSVAEIIEAGYNKSTVYRQTSEWRKRKKTATA
jgi:hypothetical protein